MKPREHAAHIIDMITEYMNNKVDRRQWSLVMGHLVSWAFVKEGKLQRRDVQRETKEGEQ